METLKSSNVIAITGANGFIGRYLVEALSKIPDISLKLLVRNVSKVNNYGDNVTQIKGDLTKPESLKGFLSNGCTLVNLAYSFKVSNNQNITAMTNLIDICVENKIKRLIHCSTAAVYGRVSESCVDELSECNPKSDYGKTKLQIEQLLGDASKGNFEYVNVRPTAVYGPDGQALMKLIKNLENGSHVLNYFRSCLFNVRLLNLVHVSNVVSAIIFLMDSTRNVDGQTYIVSEDFEVNNNYMYVESYLLKRLTNRKYSFPRVHIPLFFLSLFLKLLGRDSINPRMVYNANKLKDIGFNYDIALDDGLDELCTWYETQNTKTISGDA